MLTKTKNIRKKSKKNFFPKIQKTSERIAQGKPQLKFERNPCVKLGDNCDTDGRTDGRTTDGRQTTDKLRFHELCYKMNTGLSLTLSMSLLNFAYYLEVLLDAK